MSDLLSRVFQRVVTEVIKRPKLVLGHAEHHQSLGAFITFKPSVETAGQNAPSLMVQIHAIPNPPSDGAAVVVKQGEQEWVVRDNDENLRSVVRSLHLR